MTTEPGPTDDLQLLPGMLPTEPLPDGEEWPWASRRTPLNESARFTKEVAGCSCPDCGAPMSIRMWLLLADCWRCNTSIELSEELIRELESASGTPAPPPPPAVPSTSVAAPIEPLAAPETPPNPAMTVAAKAAAESTDEAPQLQTRVAPNRKSDTSSPDGRRRVAAASQPTRVRRRVSALATAGPVRVWVRDKWRDTPAYLVSLVLHLVALLLLALWQLSLMESDPPYITLSTVIDNPKEEGGIINSVPSDEPQFEPDIDPKDLPPTKEARVKLYQDARELRIDEDQALPHGQPIGAVRDAIASNDPSRRALAVRDPRVRGELVNKEGGTSLTEAAVTRGLRFLASQQRADGTWHAGSATGGTSLALLPFLGAGQTHLVGNYQQEVARGLKYLLSIQKEDGDLRGDANQHHGMYVHGQATIVLCEAYKMTGDEQLRVPAQKAVDFVVNAQHVGGGWRYRPAFEDKAQQPDTSVTGWQVMALYSGKAAYLNVPDSAMQLSGYFLDQVQGTASGMRRGQSGVSYGAMGGLYAYSKGTPPTPSMTAEGLLCRMMLGWKLDHPGMQEGVGWLLENHLPGDGGPDLYYWYYGTQVMHHVGGKPWNRWNIAIRDRLVSLQANDGSWPTSICKHGGAGGLIYTTALSTATLEVYYRHAPLFRQIDLE